MEKLSAMIITFNEENNIKEALDCLHFADEIVVVDSYSSDKTISILESYPKVKIFQKKFEDYTSQRNFALAQAANNWVLFLDADERITALLETEIKLELTKKDKKVAYYFLRTFYFNKKPMHFSGTQGDKNFRLFRKDKVQYISEKLVHETLQVNGTIGILKTKLLHFSYDDYHVYKNKMIKYGQLKGRELFLKGNKYNAVMHYLKTIFKFIKTYFIRLGILDGKNGIVLCYLQTLSVYQTYKSLKKEINEK
jgi:glycosyltransferase involved in cell wall biosynthesis